MNGYALLATFCQDWSIIGWPVWLSLAIGTTGALATAGRRFPSQAVQLRIGVLLPLIAFSCCMLTRYRSLPGFFYKCYYAQLDVAFIISFAFCVGFTLGALRARNGFSRVCGRCFVPAYGWLCYKAFHYLALMHHWWELGAA